MGKLLCPLLFSVLLGSCDLLRGGSFEVIAWSPGPGFHGEDIFEVSLTFSLDPDRVSVERSFSLTENTSPVTGLFIWEGSKLIFRPHSPLEKNADYLMTLKTDAQDRKGLSLERQFETAFTTRPEGGRPLLLETIPPEGGILGGERDGVDLLFSAPLARNSLTALSFAPSIAGVWSLEDGGRRARFSPSESWTIGGEYRLTLGSALASDTGLSTGREYNLHFSAGLDREAPELLSARGEEDGAAVISLSESAENAGWERKWKLALHFSEEVNLASLVEALSCEPSLGLVLDTPPGFSDRAVFSFTETPVHGTSFTLKLGKGLKDRAGNVSAAARTWKIRADGAASKAPVFMGIRLPLEPGEADEKVRIYSRADLLENLPLSETFFPFDTAVPVWIELYFETAPGASPVLLSLMDRFSIGATNRALGFSPREFRDGGFTMAEPAEGWESMVRIEVRGGLTNRPSMGMVSFETGQGLEDSLGNISAESFRILLLK
jgi:hypothetical protein